MIPRLRWRIPFVWAFVGLAALTLGCSTERTTDPARAAADNAAARALPSLAVDKTGIDLGTVTSDQEGIQTFLVMNRGGSQLELGPVDLVIEQGCDEVEVPAKTSSIQPGELAILPVRLGPHRELGPHRLLVNLNSNDPAAPVTTLSMRFDVVEAQSAGYAGPRLVVDKEAIDIGAIPYDWPMYEQFTLRNAGDQPLVLDGPPEVRVIDGC